LPRPGDRSPCSTAEHHWSPSHGYALFCVNLVRIVPILVSLGFDPAVQAQQRRGERSGHARARRRREEELSKRLRGRRAGASDAGASGGGPTTHCAMFARLIDRVALMFVFALIRCNRPCTGAAGAASACSPRRVSRCRVTTPSGRQGVRLWQARVPLQSSCSAPQCARRLRPCTHGLIFFRTIFAAVDRASGVPHLPPTQYIVHSRNLITVPPTVVAHSRDFPRERGDSQLVGRTRSSGRCLRANAGHDAIAAALVGGTRWQYAGDPGLARRLMLTLCWRAWSWPLTRSGAACGLNRR